MVPSFGETPIWPMLSTIDKLHRTYTNLT